jgi:PAS domain S-box-containing protein
VAPPRLFLRFALLSGLALVAALVLTLLVVRSNTQAQARNRAVGEARALATQFSSDNLSTIAFEYWGLHGRLAASRLGFIDDFFSPTVAGPEAASVVLYSPSGLVTYAATRRQIGTRAADPGVVRRALSRPQYTVSNGVQSAYVAVPSQFRAHTVLGVLRLEHRYAPIAADIRHDFVSEGLTVALALIALYLAMLPVMRRVTSSLRRGYVERAELAAIVDHSNDAIVAQTPDGVITSWNAGAEAVYGWTAAEVVGRHIDVLLPAVRELDPATEVDISRTTHVRKDGSPVTVSVTVSPIRDADGELVGTSMIVRDVTELSRLEAELHESHRQEAVGRLAGGIARDVGELLAEIDVAGAEQDLAAVRRACMRGAALVKQLLAVGGVQETNPELLDLNACVNAAARRVYGLVGPNISVDLELEAELGPVLADPHQVEQVILNLAANAQESMPAGGRILVRTENVDFARRTREGGLSAGHHVMFAVSDTGTGDDDGGERMTLGLAAVAGIVKQSGGTMGIETRPEGGTVVRVYLPRAEEAALAAPLARAQSA